MNAWKILKTTISRSHFFVIRIIGQIIHQFPTLIIKPRSICLRLGSSLNTLQLSHKSRNYPIQNLQEISNFKLLITEHPKHYRNVCLTNL